MKYILLEESPAYLKINEWHFPVDATLIGLISEAKPKEK